MKKLLITLILLFLTSKALAYNFGTFTYQDSKTAVDTNVSFTLGMINPGDTDVQVSMSAENLENGRVEFSRNNFVLEPTEVSENPGGEGWMSIGGGKYAKVERIPFHVLMDRKVDEEFRIGIRAERPNSDSNTGIRPKAVQLRDYGYAIDYAEEEAPSVYRGYTKEDDAKDGIELVRPSENSSDEEISGSKTNTTEEDGSDNSSKASKTSDGSTSKQRDEVGGTTLLLSIGAVGSLIYLWMVV